PVEQSTEGVTYAHTIEKLQAHIDWNQPAAAIERRLRAFDPSPGCESTLGGAPLKIWRAAVGPASGSASTPPGTITALSADRLTVQCADGALDLITVQKPGGKRMPIADFLRGSNIQTGWRFV
ncbi:MAG: methionyl-tRNA formyltransferase, partial [Usitatibacteraceae bacterium]